MSSAFKKLGRILHLSLKRAEKRRRSSADINVINSDSTITSASQVSLHSIFSYFDINKDGKIGAEELQSCVRMLGSRELTLEESEGLLKSLDLDGDGMLRFDEFEQLMNGKRGEDEKERELKAAFRMFEMEGNGEGITASGLKRMLKRLGEVWSIEECRVMIREFDLDGDGVISFDEFVAMMR